MKQSMLKVANYCEHMCALLDAPCSLLMIEPELKVKYTDKKIFCDKCGACNHVITMYYGCSEAYRWNGKYVFYCPKGLVFIASSFSNDQSNLAGGMLVGPFVMGDIEDTLEVIEDPETKEAIKSLQVWDTIKVRHIEEILCAVAASVSTTTQSLYGNFVYEQEKLLSTFYEMKNEWQNEKRDSTFLIQSEKQMDILIENKDKDGAQKLLNEMLGYICFTGNANFYTIKARLVEMLVLLSRSAIDAGAGIQEIFLFNEGNLKQLEEISSIEEISEWITVILYRFIQYSFDFTTIKHSDVLYKIMQYVKANYDKKITLEDVASHVYLSRSYISSMFKKEMGESLISYVNRIRVDKSKILLLNESVSLVNVGSICGFDDQSYFTKVFKSIVGISPKKFRDCRGKMNTRDDSEVKK
jgi:YesN/AraC family two-component response regulator